MKIVIGIVDAATNATRIGIKQHYYNYHGNDAMSNSRRKVGYTVVDDFALVL